MSRAVRGVMIFFATLAVATTPALAGTAGPIFGQLTSLLQEIIGLVAGPIAQVAVLVLVIAIAFLYLQGRHDHSEGTKYIAVLAIFIGLAIGAAAIINTLVQGATIGLILDVRPVF